MQTQTRTGGAAQISWPPIMTKQDAAFYARIHERTIERAMHDGSLTYGGPRGARRISREALYKWLTGNEL